MENLNDVWDFVQKYYPKYSSCNSIAYNDDLQKIKDGELNGQAEIIYNEFKKEIEANFAGSLDDEELIEKLIDEKVNHAWNESCTDIFERAIQGFLDKNVS